MVANTTNSQVLETVARITSTLGSPARLKILQILAQAPRPVEAISEIIGESVANTSQHLQRLLREGLVSVKKEKLSRIYKLKDPAIARLTENLFDLAEKISPTLTQISLSSNKEDRHISLLSILQDVQNQRAILLDVREEYEATHSPVAGTISIPLEVLRKHAKTLAKNKTYYIFCRGRACSLAMEGVEMLRSFGLKAFRLKECPTSVQEILNPEILKESEHSHE